MEKATFYFGFLSIREIKIKMRKVLVFVILVWWISSCNKNNPHPYLLNGTYAGTFHRSGDTSAPSNVQINFYEDSFSGTSDRTFYPAICNGTYRVFGDSIAIQNLCAFPADFDWTFIFNGNFSFSMQGDSVYFTRNYGDFAYMPDVYALKKQ
jgi:hypothetical protein